MLLLLAFPAAAAPFLGAKALFPSALERGELWGLPPAAAAAKLGLPAGASAADLGPEGYLSQTLARAFSGGKRDALEGFSHVEVAERAWLVAREGRVVGFLQKVPIDDWDAYEAQARKRYGEPRRIHFPLTGAPPGDSPEYMHLYRWGDAKSRFYIIKKAPRSDTRRWRESRSGAEMRLRLMQKQGSDYPLHVAVLAP